MIVPSVMNGQEEFQSLNVTIAQATIHNCRKERSATYLL